jgi:hypothetical protein
MRSAAVLFGRLRLFLFSCLVKSAHPIFSAVVATRSERFALHICELNCFFLKQSLHCYIFTC